MALTKINNNTLSAITGLPAGVGGKVLQVVSTQVETSVATTSPSRKRYGWWKECRSWCSSCSHSRTLWCIQAEHPRRETLPPQPGTLEQPYRRTSRE